MRGLMSTAMVVILGMAGCAHSHARRDELSPRYYVPTAAIVQRAGCDMPAHADQVLPGSDGDYFIARGVKAVYGNTPIAEYSAYSIYTYDAQAIAVPGSGFGYRYRWVLQQGLSAPPPAQ
jgi:hypothetical protein